MKHLSPEHKALLVLFTTHHTLVAEDILKDNDIRYRLVVKPRHISTDCGLAIEIPAAEKTVVQAIMAQDTDLDIEGYYHWEDAWLKDS